MQGKFIIWLLATFLLAGTSFAQAQQLKVYHVGVLVVGSADIPQIMGLRDGLRELGYIQGKNLALDISAKDTYEEYRPLVKSYKEKKPDLLVTIGGTATGIVKELAPEIPTVFYFVQTQYRRDSLNPSRDLKQTLPA